MSIEKRSKSGLIERPQPDGNPRASTPDEETKVLCPVCRSGMVSPEVAKKIRDLLEKDAHDGPRDSSVPKVGGE